MLSEHFNDHLNVHQFKDILKRKAGESIEVDWAGQRPHWSDPDTVATDQLTDISLPSYGRLPDLLKSCPQLVRICPPIVDIRNQPVAKHIRIIINFRSGSSKHFSNFAVFCVKMLPVPSVARVGRPCIHLASHGVPQSSAETPDICPPRYLHGKRQQSPVSWQLPELTAFLLSG